MSNLVDDVEDGQSIIVSVRPEEFSIEDKGIKVKVKSSTFFGRYNNYEIIFEEGMVLNTQLSCELTQDLGHAVNFYKKGDISHIVPNSSKINVFTEDGEQSLIKDVKKYDKA